MVVHGTRHDAWPLILESGGLKRMRRNHVHFATGVPEQLQTLFREKAATSFTPQSEAETRLADNTDGEVADGNEGNVAALPTDERIPTPTVLSGMRNSSTLLIYINLRAALTAGLKFYKSENGVVLSEGDAENGVVGIEFFERVEEKGGRVLVQDGKVVEEANEEMLERAKKGAAGRGGRGGGRGRSGRGGGRGGRGGRGEGEPGTDGAASGDEMGRGIAIGRGGMAAREAARGPLGVIGTD